MKSYLVVLALIATILGVPAAASPDSPDPAQASARAIQSERERIPEPPAIAEQPWLQFNPARASAYCNPGWVTRFDRLTKECKAEFWKAAPAVWRTVIHAMLPAIAQNQSPHLQGGLAMVGLENRGGWQSIQDIADAAGVPVASVACLIKGGITLSLGEGAVTDDVLATVDAATDIYQLFGMLKAGTTGAKLWLEGKSVADAIGQTGGGSAGSQVRGIAQKADTASGPAQVPGWFERIAKPVVESSYVQLRGLKGDAERAKGKFETCDIDGALAIRAGIPVAARQWAQGWRNFIEYMENQKFCADSDMQSYPEYFANMFDYPEADKQWMNAVTSYTGYLKDLEREEILDPDWARPSAVATRRKEIGEIAEKIQRVRSFETRHPLAPCDVGSVLEDLKWLLRNQMCVDGIEGVGTCDQLSRSAEPLREFGLAIESMNSLIRDAQMEAETRIEACIVEDWSEPLQHAQDEFDRLYRGRWTMADLKGCWDTEWPFDAIKGKAAQKEAELELLIAEIQVSIGEARALLGECRFEEVQERLNAAEGLIYTPQCDLESAVCHGNGVGTRRCRLLAHLEAVDEAQVEFGNKRTEVDEAMLEVRAVGDELLEYGSGELERARVIAPGRCVALVQISEAAMDLEALRPPLDCPGDSPFVEQAANLRLEAEQIAADFETYLADLGMRAEAAVDACDAEGLTGLREQIEAGEAAACPPRSELTVRFTEVLDQWQRDVDEARAIMTEASADLDLWMGACDVTGLHNIAGREMMLSECGLQQLDDQARERAAFLMHIHDLAASLQAEAQSADAHLKNAETYVEAAERELGVGIDPAVEHEAAQINLDKARAALDRARAVVPNIKVGQYMPQSCVQRVIDRISAIAASMPTIPDADQRQDLEPQLVTVPDLNGEEEAYAAAWLEDVGLTPVIRYEREVPQGGADAFPGSVIGQLPSGGAERPRGYGVLLRVYAPAAAPEATSTSTTVRQAQAAPPEPFPCPDGQARSRVDGNCHDLAVPGLDTAAVLGCSGGRIPDRHTGECVCAWGTWDGNSCVDTEAARRVEGIAEAQRGTECENLFTTIETLSASEDAFQRQRAVAAKQQAEAMGCDPGRIATAIAGSGRFGPPSGSPSGGTSLGGGGEAGGGESNAEDSSSGEANGGSGSGGGGGNGPCPCVDENGQRYRVSFGMPCELEVSNRDYLNCQCTIVDNAWAQGAEHGVAYLAYHNPASSQGTTVAPEVYGVLAVPRRIERGHEIVCNNGRSCLRVIQPSVPFTILGEYSSKAAADEIVRQRCPNPANIR